jgi:hypothetical protein
MAHQHCKFDSSGRIPLAKNAILSTRGFLESLSLAHRSGGIVAVCRYCVRVGVSGVVVSAS